MAVLRAAGATVFDEHGRPPRIEPDPDRHYRIVAAASEAEGRALLAASADRALASAPDGRAAA